MKGDQLGLLLWKNYVIRKRQPGILALVFLWPVVIFMILYTVRDNVDPKLNPTCQFPARMMPQDGLLPFVQSYICSLGNPCEPLDEYEELPSYKNAKLGPLITGIQPMLSNETILSAVKTLPHSIRLLKSMAQILTRPEIKQIFDRGIRLGDLFTNHDVIKSYLRTQVPNVREELIEGIFNSSVRLYYLIESFGSSDIDGVICSPESLKKYLVVSKEEDLLEISKTLCNVKTDDIPKILEKLSKHLDFGGLLEMAGRVLAKFREYDFFEDLRKTAETILNLKSARKYIPEYLKMHEWVPKVIPLFKNVSFKEIDLNFINNALTVLDPIFEDERDWKVAKGGFQKLNSLLKMVKDVTDNQSKSSVTVDDIFSLVNRITGDVKEKPLNFSHIDNVSKMLDMVYLILIDGVKLTNKLIHRHESEIDLAAETLDALYKFFPKKVMNSMTYLISFLDNIVGIVHHIAGLHEDTLNRIYQVSLKHKDFVMKVVTHFQPSIYEKVIRAFSRLDFVEKFVENLEKGNVADLICEQETMSSIFSDFQEIMMINTWLCEKEGKRFITDVYASFEINRFAQIVENTLSTFVNMALRQPVKIEQSNLTTAVRTVQRFLDFMNKPKTLDPDWSEFDVPENWKDTFEKSQTKGRLDVLGVHLSVAKMLGLRSISYFTIKPDLENMDFLANMILEDVHTSPTNWIADIRNHLSELIEAFYLTASDRPKALKILEYNNFTRSYCMDRPSPDLINYPVGSNVTLLKGSICRISKSVQMNLEINITSVKIEETAFGKRPPFNWTSFNEKAIEIYEYIDTLVHQKDQEIDSRKMEKLRENFKNAWTTDITIEDAFEIAVGSICQLFNIMEAPLFQIQEKHEWKKVYAIAWASSVISDVIEKVVDQIQHNNYEAKLSEIFQDLPQTEHLLDLFLGNLPSVMLDASKTFTVGSITNLISIIDEYKSREPNWPCIQNESVGSALELRNGSKMVVREIERIACNPGLFIKEWQEHPVFVRVRQIFQEDDSAELPSFNWTMGYLKFRKIVGKIVKLDGADSVVLSGHPNLTVYVNELVPEALNLVKQHLPNIREDGLNSLDFIDLEIDKAVPIFTSNYSAMDIWASSDTTLKLEMTDKMLIFGKFLSHFIDGSLKIVKSVFRDGPGKLQLLSVLGFNGKSVVSIIYNQLPYVLSMITKGISDPKIHILLRDRMFEGKPLICPDIFSWFSKYQIGLTKEEFRILQNFVCNMDPENFNTYMDFYQNEALIFRRPVSTYRSKFLSLIGTSVTLGKKMNDTLNRNAGDILELPFSKNYWKYFERVFKKSLNTPVVGSEEFFKEEIQKIGKHSNAMNDILIVNGLSEMINQVSKNMMSIQIKNNEIHLWDLMRGDVRELLRILEDSPENSISLTFTVLSIFVKNNANITLKDLRKDLCSFQYNSEYWTGNPNRTRFLKDICGFDPHQLLKTATSDEFYDTVMNHPTHLSKEIPLPQSLSSLLESIETVRTETPGLSFRSNILNFETWRSLSNETWLVINSWHKTWIDDYVNSQNSIFDRSPMDEKDQYLLDAQERYLKEHHIVEFNKILQIFTSVFDLISGGDIWQKLRIIYENSRVKPILNLMEDLPNLVITAVDTFVTSERLTDFVEKLFGGPVVPCDIDKFLIPPNFMRKKGLLSTISNFCQKIVFGPTLSRFDFLPVTTTDHQFLYKRTSPTKQTIIGFNTTSLYETVLKLQTSLINYVLNEPQVPKTPIWWTSFEEGSLKDFVKQYKKKDSKILSHSVVKKVSNLMKNLLKMQIKFSPSEEKCSWCNTLLIDILNTQLSHHRLYGDLLCRINRLKIEEIHETVQEDFYWNKTIDMIKNFKYLPPKKSLDQFMGSLETTLHYVTDIILDFQNRTHHETIRKCFYKFVGGPNYSRPGLYAYLAIGFLDSLEKNTFLLDVANTHEDILRLTHSAEKSVPIWKPLSAVVKNTDSRAVGKLLPNATINVNWIANPRPGSLCSSRKDCQNATVIYERLKSRNIGKVLRYDPRASNYPSLLEIAGQLSRSLDFSRIDTELIFWRQQANWDLTWIKEILRHLSRAVEEGGSLLDVASQVDFQDVSNVLGVPDVVDGVVNLLNDKTIDKLFDALRDVTDDIEPFIPDKDAMADLRTIIGTLETMQIFKNLGLLDMKYVISEMFHDFDQLRTFLIEKIGIPKEIVAVLSESKIDLLSVFLKERKAMSLSATICSPEKLGEMLNFEEGRITAKEVSEVLCGLGEAQAQNVTITLIQNLNFDYVFKNLMSANVKSILANANLTEAEGKQVFDNIGTVGELVPFFREKLSGSFSSQAALQAAEEVEVDKEEGEMTSSKFLQESSEMLCGRALISDNSEFYKIISKIEDNTREDDLREQNSLPTDFCRETYKSFVRTSGGKIVWSYVKPLLRGHILYSPKTAIIDEVMTLANDTFQQMYSFGGLINSFEKTLISLADLSEMGDSLKDLQEIMSSEVMKLAVKSLSGGNFEGNLSNLDLSEVAWRIKKSKKLTSMVGMLNQFMDCVLIDRYHGFDTEEELEKEAEVLMQTNEFLAAVVFLDTTGPRERRSLETHLPEDVVYKIRMDVDYVPTTKRLKTQFWIPGPESSFVEDLRYLRGFVQLQDAVDRAVIRIKSDRDQTWKTLTQQMPYPCWRYAPFQTTLYESQGVQITFFFALMMFIGSAVRYIVWERESQNAMVMSVMGLKPWRNTFAWFITSYIELMIVMLSIFAILILGRILPHSDPTLIIVLFVIYSFSLVTFCYMISTMFSSASLAAVTTVVMFLLTYMPYVIVIAMEAVMGLCYKILICFSMSTTFCYACLYAVRKEVQGVGLQWDGLWEESQPGDPMSLGLVLFMLILDGCLYGLIGYLIARYTNSGNGFHGLRSRSLWWADTHSLYGRPTYLAFVNNLSFTNDVLAHPSATTYQDDESDVSCLTVNEKLIGVRFDAVRKIYHTDQGDRVAVDDFTLKLCEGEVTSLLGRNGAGKTTIIKMLTGMLAPTSGEICLNGEEGTKPEIGVCPQDNVLIGTLTPREHMTFYAKLKKPVDSLEMQRDVNSMLASLELGRQEHEPVCRLSGGTKRRLCVALAFLGSPKLVILDEPGAGVDPAARRRIWRLIDQHRIGRTVLLSTHHLDEADMLSDTVVVMHKGKILCTGSPLTLKTTYGQGYKLHLSFQPRDPKISSTPETKYLETIRNLMEGIVANSTVFQSSETDVTVLLPFQGKHGGCNDIAEAAKVLEQNQSLLGFSHISLECDSLEKVFLDLCSGTIPGGAITRTSMDSVASVDTIGLSVPKDNVDLIMAEESPNPNSLRQIKALLKKRLWHFAKDWRAPLAALLLPTMFVAVAMGFSLIRPPTGDEPALPLAPKLYNIHPTYFYSIDNGNDPFLQHVSLQLHDRFGDDYAGAWQTLPNDTGTCQCNEEGQHVCHGVSKAVEGLLQTLPGRSTLDWIVSTHQEYIEKRYGGWSLSHYKDEPLFIVWYNNKGHHSLPAYLNALNEAILRASGVSGHLTTLNHPLKLSSEQLNRTSLLQHVADVGVALVLLVAFSLVAAQGARELVRERLSEEKRILLLAGVHPVIYWTTALLWDFLVFGCAICLAVIVFEIFGLPAYVARDNLPGVCLLLTLFAWASIPFTHLAEKAFDDSSLSNMVLFCVNTFIGVLSLATILVLDILGKSKTTEDIRNILHHVLLLFPQYALGDALVQILKNDITAELLGRFRMDTYKSPLGWDLIGYHYIFLAMIGMILFTVNLLIECQLVSEVKGKRKPAYEVIQEDEDVAMERVRVEKGLDNDILKTIRLRKEYSSVYGKNVAVENLSFGVQAGKCFGLLGVNGAGKSTTFKMLTTEIRPTAGKIVLNGQKIGNGPLCNGEIGYCPQTDALDGFLSPHQCLTIHGEVCGMANVPRAVESMLQRFDLVKYAHQRVSSLSGGNKRKLCAAISVMSPVSVLLMDEPTSGMDPATKALVAKAVTHVTKNQGCVIMTSHSVAECETLCHRVGILAKASLRCIGTPQHLKHKFGEGYVMFLRFGQPVSSSDLKKVMLKHLPQAIISSKQVSAARLLVPRNPDLTLSGTFSKTKDLANELKATDFTLCQSSLDQVLVNFSEELEDDAIEAVNFVQGNRISFPNIYSSLDTIHLETF